MVSSHKKPNPLKFSFEYLFVSVFLVVSLLVYSYWDIIHLRYVSGFFDGAYSSDSGQELFVTAFKNKMTLGFSTILPVLVTLVLSVLIAYLLYNSYKFTLRDLDVNHNYVNAKKLRTRTIVLYYFARYTLVFVVPIFFWCFYFLRFFPMIAKIPLSFIFGSSTLQFIGISLLIFVGLLLLTQFGLVMTRLSVKIVKVR